jgi:hypothetical protein
MHLPILVAVALAATFEPNNLKGITSMRVIVENVPGADKVGLDPNAVQTDVEANLRKGGIKVTPMAGILPCLYLQVTILTLPDRCVVYSMHLSLKTDSNIVATKEVVLADLWSDGTLRAHCKNDKKDKTDVGKIIRQAIVDETNKLVSDIRSAN